MYQIKYSKLAVLTMLALCLFVTYISFKYNMFFFGLTVNFAIILNISTSFKTGVFGADSVVFRYPFRPFKNIVTVNYNSVVSIEVGSGTYIDGPLIIVKFWNNGKICKRLLDYPGTKTWAELSRFLKSRKVKVI